jgi:hypothetical protein
MKRNRQTSMASMWRTNQIRRGEKTVMSEYKISMWGSPVGNPEREPDWSVSHK